MYNAQTYLFSCISKKAEMKSFFYCIIHPIIVSTREMFYK